MEAGARYEIAPEDRKRLVAFLWRLRDLLELLVFARQELISPHVAGFLEEAWEELQREGRFEQAVNQVEEGEWDRRLIDHGLYGAQLALKLGIFDRSGLTVTPETDEASRITGLKGFAGACAACGDAASCDEALRQGIGVIEDAAAAPEADTHAIAGMALDLGRQAIRPPRRSCRMTTSFALWRMPAVSYQLDRWLSKCST